MTIIARLRLHTYNISAKAALDTFSKAIEEHITSAPAASKLPAYSWQVDLSTGLSLLSKIQTSAQQASIDLIILVTEDEPVLVEL